MSLTIDELVERSGALKQELLDFARAGRLGRELASGLVERFGDPIATDEHGLISFLDDWGVAASAGCRADGRRAIRPRPRRPAAGGAGHAAGLAGSVRGVLRG
jgi:hypothetical protein